MAFTSTRGSFSTSRGTILAYPSAPGVDWRSTPGVEVYLRTTIGTAYLGGTGVTKLTGYGLVRNDSISVNVDPGETLCAVSPTGTATVHIMQSARD